MAQGVQGYHHPSSSSRVVMVAQLAFHPSWLCDKLDLKDGGWRRCFIELEMQVNVPGKFRDATPLTRYHVVGQPLPRLAGMHSLTVSITHQYLQCRHYSRYIHGRILDINNQQTLRGKMTPPSYARATASSTSRSNPKCLRTNSTKPTKNNPPAKILKRPSPLTPEKRTLISYTRSLHPIMPHIPSLPCPLALLPPELRIQIYTYVFTPRSPTSIPPNLLSTPALLHTCRALRIEAAYTFYTRVPSTWTLHNLHSTHLTAWVDSLLRAHRALLGWNKGLEVHVPVRLLRRFTYAPPGFELDAYVAQHWAACARWGNVYALGREVQRRRFIVFCRLAEWWEWCGDGEIEWRYNFHPLREAVGAIVEGEEGRALLRFLVEELGPAVTGRCVRRAWTRNTCGRGMKREAGRWLDALDACWAMAMYAREEERVVWREQMKKVRSVVEGW